MKNICWYSYGLRELNVKKKRERQKNILSCGTFGKQSNFLLQERVVRLTQFFGIMSPTGFVPVYMLFSKRNCEDYVDCTFISITSLNAQISTEKPCSVAQRKAWRISTKHISVTRIRERCT